MWDERLHLGGLKKGGGRLDKGRPIMEARLAKRGAPKL